ncbi:hypothetical protein P154DRAFT_405346, partial [Amniculicola lignicola CBS 123094]
DEDIKDPNAWRTVDDLVTRLLDPPRESYPGPHPGHNFEGMIRIRLQWVKGAVGEQHFRLDTTLGRSVLNDESKLRTYGVEAGLPPMYHKWLCG